MSTTNTQKQAAKQFVKEWAGKGYEKGETQRFWIDLLHTVFGIDNQNDGVRAPGQDHHKRKGLRLH